MKTNLSYSEAGLDLTEGFEGLRLEAYEDVGGVWTIGYGHTKDVYPGMIITQEEAESFLYEDIQFAVNTANKFISYQLTQNQFDAVVDLIYNIGISAFSTSTMLKFINSGQLAKAALEFSKWDHVHGKVIAGLSKRRQAEYELFNGNS
jgi:lysozyme